MIRVAVPFKQNFSNEDVLYFRTNTLFIVIAYWSAIAYSFT